MPGIISMEFGLARTPAIQKPGRTLACSISKQRAGGSSIKPGTSAGRRERKAQGQDWRPGDAD